MSHKKQEPARRWGVFAQMLRQRADDMGRLADLAEKNDRNGRPVSEYQGHTSQSALDQHDVARECMWMILVAASKGVDMQPELPQGERQNMSEFQITGTRCSMCGDPQYATPGGHVCANGHGGAPPMVEP